MPQTRSGASKTRTGRRRSSPPPPKPSRKRANTNASEKPHKRAKIETEDLEEVITKKKGGRDGKKEKEKGKKNGKTDKKAR
jgi:hypothetical protein